MIRLEQSHSASLTPPARASLPYPAGIYHQPMLKSGIKRKQPWPHNLNEMVPSKSGAVQPHANAGCSCNTSFASFPLPM